jgi:uncharacterized membrane protein
VGGFLFRILAVTAGPFAFAALLSMCASLFPRTGFFLALFGLPVLVLWTFRVVRRATSVEWERSRFLSLLMLPALLVGIFGTAAGIAAGDYLHVIVAYPEYVLGIQESPQSPARFLWGDYAVFVTDGLQEKTLIFDPTHATIIEERPYGDGLRISTRHLMTDFYLEEIYSAP